VAEINYRNTKFYGMSLYFDITEDTEINIRKTELILNYLKGQCLLITADSNARSKTWYDTMTNQRGKVLEDFLTTSNLYIVNDRSVPTFKTTRGSSFVGLTIVSNQLLRRVTDWKCSIQ
jgi:endo-beta-N-acetylglucosaminidase D